jgi:hypothetical protein
VIAVNDIFRWWNAKIATILLTSDGLGIFAIPYPGGPFPNQTGFVIAATVPVYKSVFLVAASMKIIASPDLRHEER